MMFSFLDGIPEFEETKAEEINCGTLIFKRQMKMNQERKVKSREEKGKG